MSTIAPEKRTEIQQRIAQRWADRREDNLLNAIDNGWLLFRKGKPRERRIGYMRNTLEADAQWVMNPNYLTLLANGQAPPLQAVILAGEYAQWTMQAQQLAEIGTPPELIGQAPFQPPMMWPIITIKLPGIVFQRLSRDFRDLMREFGSEPAQWAGML